MLYMLRGPSASGMTGMPTRMSQAAAPVMSGAASPPVPIQVFAVGLGAVLIAYAVWDLCVTLPSTGKPGSVIVPAATPRMLAPRVAGGCQALMCLAMAGMVMATV